MKQQGIQSFKEETQVVLWSCGPIVLGCFPRYFLGFYPIGSLGGFPQAPLE
jgi:hypothetical protein